MENVYPAFVVAVTVMDEPESNVPPPLVVPPAAGFDDNVTVKGMTVVNLHAAEYALVPPAFDALARQ